MVTGAGLVAEKTCTVSGRNQNTIIWPHSHVVTWTRTQPGDRLFNVVSPCVWYKSPAPLHLMQYYAKI